MLLMVLPVYGNEGLTFGSDITIGGERYTLTVDGEVVEEESEEDIELTEEEVQQVSDAINALYSKMEDT